MHNFEFPPQRGFTLVELMVGLSLSLFLIGGIVLMQSSTRATFDDIEKINRQQENIRFAGDFLVRHLRFAGFRDQLTLTIAEFDEIGEQFAEISDTPPGDDGVDEGEELTIRYSGLGSCAEGFDNALEDPRMIADTFFVQEGELKCRSRVAQVDDAGNLILDQDGMPVFDIETATLAPGIESIRFDLLCPAGNPNCECTLWSHGEDVSSEEGRIESACIGVEIEMTMESDQGGDPLVLDLSASFRNILLGHLMWTSIPTNNLDL
ncbi:MAG: prepilin-type N-terminal cleavage/methylation domain-containing protein [Wenzhouxiangellaceae bacterium]|nr:prepilin-type N-terminal cleavage/methylation domain-containing protein [Wenzhouxiangellaceae bacterium]